MTSIATLDVGGTSIKSGVVRVDHLAPSDAGIDPERAASAVTMGPTVPTRSTESVDVVFGQLAAAVRSAVTIADEEVIGIALAFPGPFDLSGSRALIRGLHKFESIYGLDVRAGLRDHLGDSAGATLPIEFARDSESAGVGEAVFGSGRTGRRVLTVTIGTGLGACLTDHGDVIESVGGLEIEKLARRPTPDGRADDVLSARGLAARLGVETESLRSSIDDPRVIEALHDHGCRLGTFLAPVVDELGLDLVVVGGGVVAAFDRFGAAMQAALGATPCAPAILGASGPLLGAAILTFPDRFPQRT